MLRVAITGNIASGKSVVENFLMEKSYKVLDTDSVSHNLLKDSSVKKEISAKFEGFDIFEKSEISRPKLGKIVFENKNLRETLESILYPKITEEIHKFFNKTKNEKMAFVSVPLLFEAKFEKLFDKIILIYSDDKLRLERLMNRNGLTLEQAKNRLEIQTSQDKKLSLADYVIYNNSSLNDLQANLDKTIMLL